MSEIKLQVGVKALLKNGDRYLLIKRSAEKYPEVTNLWDIVGGRIKSGQLLMSELEREVREETGLQISKARLIAAQDILKNGMHVVRLTYVADSSGDKVELSDEHDEARWLSEDEIRNMEGVDRYFKELVDNGEVFGK